MSSLCDDALEDLGRLYTCNMGLQSPFNFELKKKEFKKCNETSQKQKKRNHKIEKNQTKQLTSRQLFDFYTRLYVHVNPYILLPNNLN